MEIAGVRITPQTAVVLKALRDAPKDGLYGLQVADAVHLPTGSIYPILLRLEQAGWVIGVWEDPQQVAAEKRRRRRRFYVLTALGRRLAGDAIQRIEAVWVLEPRGQLGSPGASA
jgi:PadR family transcriptional regulator, regulatory protein PadR